MRQLRRIPAVLIASAVAVTVVGTDTTAHAADRDCAGGTSKAWDCNVSKDSDDGDKGGVSVSADMMRNGNLKDYYAVTFKAKGETLTVMDSYPDSKEAVAYLKVEGSGTARFDNHHSKSYPLSFSEGKRVWIKVGVEGTDNWTKWSPAGRT